MSRLPKSGSDNNVWGDVLNDYLLQQHNADGTHQVSAILGPPTSTGFVLGSNPGQPSGVSWTTITKTTIGLSNVTNDAQVKLSDVDADGTLAANGDGKIASQKAVKTYVDMGLSSKITASDALALSVAL